MRRSSAIFGSNVSYLISETKTSQSFGSLPISWMSTNSPRFLASFWRLLTKYVWGSACDEEKRRTIVSQLEDQWTAAACRAVLNSCRPRKVRNAQFFGNFRFQCFVLDIRNQDIPNFWISAGIVDVNKFTTILSLLLALADEIRLGIYLRRREASCDRIAARRTGVQGLHAMNLPCGVEQLRTRPANSLQRLPSEDSEHAWSCAVAFCYIVLYLDLCAKEKSVPRMLTSE